MCGIFGYVGGRKDASKLVFDGLKSLEYRGTIHGVSPPFPVEKYL